MKKLLKSLTVILFATMALGQNLPNIDTGTKGQLPVSRLKAGTSGTQCLFTDSLIVFWNTCSSGSGTVTSLSIGNLSPLFTSNVDTPTTTPSITFSLSNASAHTFFGNTSGSTGPPSFSTITAADLPGVFAQTKTNVLHKWLNSYDSTTGLFTQTQVDYSDLTGTPVLPANTTATASQFFTAYNSATGAFTKAAILAGDVPTLNQSTSGNAATATAFDHTPTLCSAGNYPLGILASGAATGCTAASGGSGTVTSVSSGNFAPLFTVSVATPTTTPAFSFTASTFAAHTFFGNNTASTAVPSAQAIGNGDLPGAGAITLNTTSPLGGGGSVSLGNALTFTCTGCLTSVTAHNLLSATHGDTTTHSVVRGDLIAGIGAVPTWTAVAKGGTNTYPKWNASGDVIASTLAAAGIGSPTACSNQFVTGFTLNADAVATSTCTTATLASAQFANQGTVNTVLHGNAAGNPAFSAVTSADTTGTFTATAHSILSATHGDTTAAVAVRGDGFFAIGASPTWQRLAHPTVTGGYFKWNGTDIIASTLAAAGTGNCGANQFETGDNADAAPTCAQPAYSGISGTPAVPTGTGYSHVTSGALDSAAKLVNLTASTDVAANQGTTTTLLHGNAAGQPSFASVVSADLNITTTTCTNQYVSAISAGAVGTCTTDVLASAQHANQGTTTTVLHGNAAGNPSFASVTSADTTGTFPATAHAILSATHSDATTGTVARGDIITGQGASPTWTRLPKGTASQCLQMDGSAVDIVWGSCAPGGSGITTLNTLTATTQTFATGTSGTDFNISSVTSTHTFNIPDASASARGLVTTGTQTIGGAKTLNGELTLAAATTGAASENVPSGTAPTTPVAGDIWRDTNGFNFVESTTANGTVDVRADQAGVVGAANTVRYTADSNIPKTSANGGALEFNVLAASALTSHAVVLGNGNGESKALSSLGTTTTVLHGNASADPAFSAIVQGDVTNGFVDLSTNQSISGTKTFDTVQLKNFNASAWFDVSGFTGATEDLKFIACIAALPSTGGVCDGSKITGNQSIASDAFNTTKPTIFILGAGIHDVSAQLNYTAPTSVTAASPSAPTTNTTTTTGGTLSGSVFVDVTYVVGSTRIGGVLGETAGSAELTVSMNAACPGTPTCTATINIPTGVTGATGVNVYESNTTGTGTKKLCNTFGPLDMGGTYQITANCLGAAMPTSTTAYVGASAIIGAGPGSTILNFNNTGAFITCGACSPLPFNWTFADFSITQILGGIGQAKIVAFGGDNLTIRNIWFAGGIESVYWDGVHNSRILNTRHSELHDGNGYISIINSFGPCDHILIDNTIIRGGTAKANTGYSAMIAASGCDFVDIYHSQIDGVDCSRSGSCGAIGLQGVHHGNVVGGTIENMISGDGVDITGNSQTGGASRWSEDITVANFSISGNTTDGGIGTFHGNSDAIGIQEAKNVIVSNVVGASVGLSTTPANRLPCVEVYLSDSVLLQGVICRDSTQGVSTNSSTNLELTSFKATNNLRSGLYANRSVSTCTVSSASANVAWATGEAFGPWPQGTPIIINGVSKVISSVTDFHNLVLTANAGSTGTFSCGVDTFMKVSNSEFDNNGQSAEAGNNNKAGLYLDNGSFAQINNSSADDNQTSKTQLNGFETAAATTARFVLNNVTGTGGTGALILDNVGNSPILRDNNSDGIWEMTTVKAVTADFVTAANTNLQTITGLTFTLPPLDARRYAIDCHLIYAQQTAGAANSGFGVQAATIAPTNIWATGHMQTNTTAFTEAVLPTLTTTTATNIITVTPTVTTNWMADLQVLVNNPSNASANTINIMVKTGTAADTMTVRKDSWCSMAGVK